MSHEATNWAIKQRGLKPTTKIVLWHLCDRFNSDYGCFPSQDRLAHDCEISRSTLNDHLGQLEAVGLLRRVPRLDPVTKRQLRTRYILGFEPGFTPVAVVPCPEIGHGEGDGAETTDMAEGSPLDAAAAALPLALGLGAGAETRQPMALAILGGVLVSTVFTLVVVPCAYSLSTRLENLPPEHH